MTRFHPHVQETPLRAFSSTMIRKIKLLVPAFLSNPNFDYMTPPKTSLDIPNFILHKVVFNFWTKHPGYQLFLQSKDFFILVRYHSDLASRNKICTASNISSSASEGWDVAATLLIILSIQLPKDSTDGIHQASVLGDFPVERIGVVAKCFWNKKKERSRQYLSDSSFNLFDSFFTSSPIKISS